MKAKKKITWKWEILTAAVAIVIVFGLGWMGSVALANQAGLYHITCIPPCTEGMAPINWTLLAELLGIVMGIFVILVVIMALTGRWYPEYHPHH